MYYPKRSIPLMISALVLSALWTATAAIAQTIERIDPPAWWVGLKEPTLELMIHGTQLDGVSVAVNAPGIRVIRSYLLENTHYLIADLEISPQAKAGQIDLMLQRNGATVAQVPYRLEDRGPHSSERQGFSSKDFIYLEVPDRFANGDVGNDSHKNASDHTNRGELFARHGGDFKGTMEHLDYLQHLGVTMLWMTPVLENAMPEASYHGYAITDHYKVDPHFGVNSDYRSLSQHAQKLGIGVIADMVPNHIGSNHFWMKDLPTHDWLSSNDPTFITNHAHSAIADPHAAEIDRERYISGWFVDSMPDLNTRRPELARYLIQNAVYWIEYADLSGLRIDTYSYSDKNFMSHYTQAILNEYPNLNIVGEEWRTQPSLVSYWQAGKVNTDGYVSHLPSLMDFPLMVAQNAVFGSEKNPHQALDNLYERLGEDFLYPNPLNLVVFADNHDTDRMFTQVHRRLARQKQNLVFLATTRGIPEIVYGDEVLLANDLLGNDGDRRKDFPGGWADDAVNAFTGKGLSSEQKDLQAFTQRLFTWRKTAKAVHTGHLTHYYTEHDVYVYFRQEGSQTVMVALNLSNHAQTLDLTRFSQNLKPHTQGVDVLTGKTTVLDRSLSIAGDGALVLDIN